MPSFSDPRFNPSQKYIPAENLLQLRNSLKQMYGIDPDQHQIEYAKGRSAGVAACVNAIDELLYGAAAAWDLGGDHE